MNLQDLLTNPAIIEQLARSTGGDTRQAQSGLEALLPAVTEGLLRNSSSSSGIESLAKALGSGGHQRYLDRPESLGDARSQIDGNAILGHIFGSKDVSRNVAGHAAQSSGLDAGLLKQLLPVVASLAMGALSKQSQAGASLQQAPSGGGGTADLLGSLLGGLAGASGAGRAGGQSNPLGDVLDLAKKFF